MHTATDKVAVIHKAPQSEISISISCELPHGSEDGISCIDAAEGGVVVSGLVAGGAAATAGLLVGDRLFSINGRTPQLAEDALALFDGADRLGTQLIRQVPAPSLITCVASGHTCEVTLPHLAARKLAAKPNPRGRGVLVTSAAAAGGCAHLVGNVVLAAAGTLVQTQQELRRALDKAEAAATPHEPHEDMEPVLPWSTAGFGLGLNATNQLTDITPGGAAEVDGRFQLGDRVIAINGIALGKKSVAARMHELTSEMLPWDADGPGGEHVHVPSVSFTLRRDEPRVTKFVLWAPSREIVISKIGLCDRPACLGIGLCDLEGEDDCVEGGGVRVLRLPPPSYSSLTSPDLGMSSSPSHSAHGAPPPPNNSGNGDDQAGLQLGDVLLAVNGTPATDHRQAARMLEKAGRGRIVLVVRR